MERGILLMAYGNAYHQYAYNLAYSIKFYSKEKVFLLCDTIPDVDTSVFDQIEIFEPAKREDGQYDHCQNKIDIYARSPFKKTLYLDVDAVCLKDISPILDSLDGWRIYSQMVDCGGRHDSIGYSVWASNDTIWEHFKLDNKAVLPALQTSIIYFEKGDFSNDFFSQLAINYSNHLSKEQYASMWGRNQSHPDELYYSVTMAQFGILPDYGIQPVFYAHKKISVTEILEKYYILSQYGAFGLTRPYAIELYDRHLASIFKEGKKNLLYKAANLYKKKFHVFK
jgi:hypothetical protein